MNCAKKKVDPRLARNYVKLGSEEQRKIYREWADTYDRELIQDFGYVAPQIAVDSFIRKAPDRTLPILDMGCGTGLVGRLLHQAGYEHIDGIDLSPEMLEKAASHQIYQNLWEGDLTSVMNIRPIYQGIICVGVFSHHPDHPFLIPKLLDGLRSDGFLVGTVNGKGWQDIGWSELLEESQRVHKFSLQAIEDIRYLDKQGIDGKLITIRP